MGFSANTVIAVNQATKLWGGKLSFLLGVLRSLIALKNPPLAVVVDGRKVFSGPALLVTVSNGKYFGGGMMIAPSARIDDGLFEVIIIGAMTRRTVLRKIKKIYRGKHLQEPEVEVARGREVRITARNATVLLEMDGEQPGQFYHLQEGDSLSLLTGGRISTPSPDSEVYILLTKPREDYIFI